MGSAGSSQAQEQPGLAASESHAALEAKAKSALEANIEAKQDLAYYYAHKRKVTGEPPAPPPQHVVLHRSPSQPNIAPPQAPASYQFLDEDARVKVYVPVEGAGQLPTDAVRSSFTDQSFDLTILQGPGRPTLRLAVGQLAGKVDVGRCGHRVTSRKVVLVLAKQPDESGNYGPWRTLTG